jgi:hypothetical protein
LRAGQVRIPIGRAVLEIYPIAVIAAHRIAIHGEGHHEFLA